MRAACISPKHISVLDRNLEAANKPQELGGDAYELDVCDTGQVEQTIAALTKGRHPRVLVNCAGIGKARIVGRAICR